MDQRVRLLTEVIAHIREVKLYAYETLFGQKVAEKRGKEMKVLRSIIACGAINSALMFFLPTMAAIGTYFHLLGR
jgi:ATP-binding cassette subfamily C (CFTR/MRP) protein 1